MPMKEKAAFLCTSIACLSIMVLSCSERRDNDAIHVRLDSAETLVLNSEVSQCVSISSQDVLLGNIMYGKSYGNVLFLYNDSKRCLYQVEDSTAFVVLDKVGRGPGEYIDIGAFTYLPETGELVIFERASRSLRFYIDGEMTRQIQLDFYVNGMEAFAPNHLLLAKEASYSGDPAYIVDYELSTRKEKQVLSLREDQIELFTDVSFYNSNGTIYFGISGRTLDIYSYGEDLQKIASVGFSPNSLGRRYWDGNFNERKENILIEALQSGTGHVALAPCLLLVSDERIYFWYATGDAIYTHNLPDRSLCIIENDSVKLYQRVLDSTDKTSDFQPIAVWEDSFISIEDEDRISIIKYSI